MAVRENLTGLQVGVKGKTNSGQDVDLYISNEVDGKYHFRIGSNNAWISSDDLKKAIVALAGEEEIHFEKNGK